MMYDTFGYNETYSLTISIQKSIQKMWKLLAKELFRFTIAVVNDKGDKP